MIQLLVMLCVLGLIWYLITSVIPLPPPVRTVALVVMTIMCIVWLLDWGSVGHTTHWFR